MPGPAASPASPAPADRPLPIRAAGPADLDAVVALAGRALGWRDGDPNAELFRWKHEANPFGPSPRWVAEDDGRPVAFRTFLRWEFDAPDGRRRRAVRAVDTATDPAYQGRGLFRALTLYALDAVRADGVDFVFNTPNDQSRPGYLKMGWQEVGEVPVAVAVRGPAALVRMVRARVPAAKWSLPTDAGVPAGEALADVDGLASLLADQPPPSGLRTARTPAFLAWRYGAGPVAYRALLATAGRVADGVAFFRLRRRGAAVEATLCDVLVPGGEDRARRRLVAAVVRAARPDYLIRVQRPVVDGRCLRLPGQGPLLTWRSVGDDACPPLDRWDLRLGDIELL